MQNIAITDLESLKVEFYMQPLRTIFLYEFNLFFNLLSLHHNHRPPLGHPIPQSFLDPSFFSYEHVGPLLAVPPPWHFKSLQG